MNNVLREESDVTGTIQDRAERTSVLGTHGFAMALGAVGGMAGFAWIGGFWGGTAAALVLGLVGAGVGVFIGRVVGVALRPSVADRVEHERLTAMPHINGE